MSLFAILAICFSLVVLSYVFWIAYIHHEAYKTFKKKSPDIPIVENFSLFGGHLSYLMCHPHNAYHFHQMHLKHGPNFAWFYTNRSVVFTTDLDILKKVLLDEPYDHLNRPNVFAPIAETREDSLMYAPDEQWLRMRKAIAPAFTSHKIKTDNVQAELRQMIERFLDSLNRRIDKSPDGQAEIDAEDIFHRFALSVVFCCFYKQPNVVDFDADKDWWQSTFDEGCRDIVNPVLRLSIIFPITLPFFEWIARTFTKQGTLYDKINQYVVEQTSLNMRAKKEAAIGLKKDSNFNVENFEMADGSIFRRNLIDYVIDQFQARKLNPREYKHNSFFLFFAANKTTADALSKIVYLLAHHQEVQDKVRRSVEEHGSDSEYLNWCIHETLRLYSPVSGGINRYVSHDLKSKYGHIIPKGTGIATSLFTIHRLKEYWGDDAEEFRPERWTNSSSFHPCQFLAFGAGKRNCLGAQFALQEVKQLMSTTLKIYRFDPSPKTSGYRYFISPGMAFNVFDEPTYVKISKLSSRL